MRVRLFGSPCWQEAGEADATRHPLPPAEALLLYLLATGGPTDRGHLAARLWPDSTAPQALTNLRQRVFRIRRALGPEVLEGTTLLRLADRVSIDVRDAEAELVADASAVAGGLLAGVDGLDAELAVWLDLERATWRHRIAGWLSHLATQAADRGDWRAALPYATRLVEEWPEDDAAYQRLMQLFVQAGDLQAARQVYLRCEETLQRADGRRPDAPTRALAAHIDAALATQVHAAAAPTQLVGRRPEWQQLVQAWRARRPVVVSGEPGLGKTRLLEHFAAAHGALAVGARPGDAVQPYGLTIRLLDAFHHRCGLPEAGWVRAESARLMPWIDATPRGPTYTLRLHAAVVEWCRHAQRCGVPGVVVDDLQYADDASLDLLPEALAKAGLGVVFAVRAAEWPALLQQRLADPRSGAAEVLQLLPFGEAGVAELLQASGIAPPRAALLAPSLWRHTGGNPYFVLQTLFELPVAAVQAGPVPDWPAAPHLQAMLRRRLAQATLAARKLAEVLALAGTDFSDELAMQLLDCDEHALGLPWCELEQALILGPDGFAHDLAREAVLADLAAPVRRGLHRRIAAAGPALGMPAVHEAAHLLAVGDDRAAAAALLRAADAAGRLSRRVEEARLLDQALGCLGRLGEPIFVALERRVLAARVADGYDHQVELVQRLVDSALDEVQRYRALVLRAAILRDGFQMAPALAAAQAATALAARLGGAASPLAAARVLGRVLEALGREDDAVRAMRPHADAALAAGDLESAHFLIEFGSVLNRASHGLRAAWPVLQHARRVAHAAADWGLLAEALVGLGFTLHCDAQVGRAAVYYRHARQVHLRTGSAFSAHLVHFVALPRLLRELGHYGESLHLLEAIQAQQQQAGYALATVATADLSFHWLQLGEPGRAAAVLDGTPPDGAYQPAMLMARARIAAWSGAPATELLQTLFDRVSTEGRILRWIAGRDLALSLPPDEGVALARQLVAEVGRVDCAHARWPLRIALCDRLLAAGQVRAAADEAAAVLQAFARRVLPSIHEPQAWCIVERALAAVGEPASARAARARGLRWVDGALTQMVPQWREGFLRRNPFVAALCAEPAAALKQRAAPSEHPLASAQHQHDTP